MDSTSAQAPAGSRKCLNCDSLLTGEFCGDCGQPSGNPIVTLGDSLTELAGEFLKFDSKLLDTLRPLIFKPGFLTAEYVVGRRVRYIQPVKLYLIFNFLLFLLASWLDPVKMDGEDAALYDFDPALLDAANAHLSSFAPPLLICIVPVFAALLAVAYFRSRRFYAEHFIFSVHYLTFFMLAIIPSLFHQNGFEWFTMPIGFIYLFFALRRNYAQSWWKTATKWAFLSAAFLILLGLWTFITALMAMILTILTTPAK